MILFKKIIIPLLCLLILFVFEYLGFLAGMNNYFMILLFVSEVRRNLRPGLSIVAIDEETLTNIGPWPIKRRYYAAALKKMQAADAVGFDIVMAESSPRTHSSPKP